MLQSRPAFRNLTVLGLVATWLAAGAVTSRAETSLVIAVPGPRAGTLAEAVATARSHRQAGTRAIVIEVSGTQRLAEPIVLGPADSGTADKPLIIRSAPGSDAAIIGSRPLTESRETLPPDVATHLPKDAQGKVRRYLLPPSAASAPRIDRAISHEDPPTSSVPFEVFDTSGALRPARWPDEGWAMVDTTPTTATTFNVSPERIGRWRNEEDLWAAGYWHWDWSFETRPVTDVDAGRGSVTLARPTRYGIRQGARFYVYHAVSELDRPGEWVRLPDHRSILLWPRDKTSSAGAIEASIADSLFVIKHARHVRFENLRLGRTRGDAIRVDNGTDVTIADCAIRWTGGRGVAFTNSRRSGIAHSVIADTGADAVSLSGGDRTTLDPAGLFVTGSRVTRFGRLARTYHPGIRLSGVGNRVFGNLIEDAPHAAILFSGNDHQIVLNEIARVVNETSDAGAIYTGRDWTSRGTVIRYNFLHDIEPASGFETKGVYLDDMASGTTVEGNLFLRVSRPVFVGGGRDNAIRDNLFIASAPAVTVDARGLTWARPDFGDVGSPIVDRLEAVPYRSAIWQERYPTLAAMSEAEAGAPSGNMTMGNLLIGTRLYDMEPSVRRYADRFGPDVAIVPERLEKTGSLDKAIRARDVAGLLNASRAVSALPPLPFARMDRARFVPPAPGGGGRNP